MHGLSFPQGYTVALDYWQLGVLMCELLTGVHPFMDKDGQVYVDAIEKRPPKLVIGGRDISTECQNLVGVLLRKVCPPEAKGLMSGKRKLARGQ